MPQAASIAFHQGRPDKIDQPFGLERLLDDSYHAEPCGSLRCLCVEPARNQDCRAPKAFSLQVGNDVETTHTGHVLVDDQ